VETTDGLAQLVDTETDLSCRIVRLHKSIAADPEADASAWTEKFGARKLDTLDDRLMSLTLREIGESDWLLLMGVHRILADCSSMEQTLQEIWQLYGELRRGVESHTLTRTSDYADYAEWQQENNRRKQTKNADHWHAHLKGATPLQWGRDLNASPVSGSGKLTCEFGQPLSLAIRSLARQMRSMPGTTVLAIFAALLYRWCAQNDFVIAFNVGGRQSQQKTIVGYFAHILYLRIQLNGPETFPELLATVSNEFFSALAHQDFGRTAQQQPHFLSGAFVQWSAWHPTTTYEVPGIDSSSDYPISVERVPYRDFEDGLSVTPPGTAGVEITFFDTSTGIYAAGFYRSDLFEPATMGRFSKDLRACSEQFAGDPTLRINDLQLSRS
jgi:hypothetical protein